MGIAATAPRGGLAEQLAGASREFILRNREIERFEDMHTGIFAVYDGFFGRGDKPTAAHVRDLVALGLAGGGMTDKAADALISDLGPDANPHLYQIAQSLIGVAFMPDVVDGGGDEPEEPGGDDAGKKPDPALGECG